MNDSCSTCLVCGDHAISKNFGAWSCKSCKTFFRRNAFRTLIKYHDGYCDITITTRKKCRKCRLDKCYAVGMRKEWILSDEERTRRKQLIEENRRKKLVINEEQESNANIDFCVTINSRQQSSDNYGVESIVAVVNTEDVLTEEDIDNVEEVIRIDEIIDRANKRYQCQVGLPRSFFNYDKKFNELEQYKFQELFQVMLDMKDKINIETTLIRDYSKSIQDFIVHNSMFYEQKGMRLINTIKRISAFESIDAQDKLCLVKYSGIQMLILTSLQYYNKAEESWTVPINEDNLQFVDIHALKLLSQEFYAVYKNNWNYIVNECDFDSVIIDLLIAITLFNHNSPDIVNKSAVEVQQRVYMHLLKRYLLFKYRLESESEDKLTRILNIRIFSHILSELEKKYYIDRYYHSFGPIAREFFGVPTNHSIKP